MDKINKINKIIADMISETVVDDADDISVEIRYSKLINGLIKNTKDTFMYDWDTDVIKSEAVAAIYESMIKTANYLKLSVDDINTENKDFMKMSYNYAERLMKKNLFPYFKHGENKNTCVILGTDVDGVDSYEEELDKTVVEEYSNRNDESELLQYMKLNQDKMLTNRQLKYLSEGAVIETEKEREIDRQLRRRIEKRVNDRLKEKTVKEAIVMDYNNIIDEILSAKDFRKAYDIHKDKNFIIDAIIDNVDAETRRAFNKGSDDPDVLKKMRIGLRRAKNFKIYN